MKTTKNYMCDFSYSLINIYKKGKGYIDATKCVDLFDGKEALNIIRFWVSPEYRGNKKRYGKQLLDCVVKEAKEKGIKRIFVTPKADNYDDDTEYMEINALYTKYKSLGFKFINSQHIKVDGNIMFLDL